MKASSLITCLAIPPISSAWMIDRSPFFSYGLMHPGLSPMRLLREQQALANRVAEELSFRPNPSLLINAPRYEMKDEKSKFAVALDLPGIAPENISVSYEESNKLLSISGHRVFSNERGSYSEKFSQSFYLDPTVDIENLRANLENGVLVVTAPRDINRIEQSVRVIPVSTPAKGTTYSSTNSAADEKEELGNTLNKSDALKEGHKNAAVMNAKRNSDELIDLDEDETLSFDLDSNEDI